MLKVLNTYFLVYFIFLAVRTEPCNLRLHHSAVIKPNYDAGANGTGGKDLGALSRGSRGGCSVATSWVLGTEVTSVWEALAALKLVLGAEGASVQGILSSAW